jgi:DNA-directed RNA polymerase specialized sigma24 family protein
MNMRGGIKKMQVEERLGKLETKIRGIARRYAYTKEDIEDFTQIGMIAAWQDMEQNPDSPIAYYLQTAKYKIWEELKKNKTQKRKPKRGIISLSHPLSKEGNRTIEDTIGKKDVNPFIDEEITQSIIIKVKNKEKINWQTLKNEITKVPAMIVRALIEDVAKIPFQEISERVDYNFFRERGFQAFLWAFYNNSPYKAVNDAYPKKFLKWNWHMAPLNTWKGKRGLKNAKAAMEWFVKKKELDTPKKCRNIKTEDFKEEGLGGMLQICFHDSPYLALKSVISDLEPWQAKQTPKNYFDKKENRIKATLAYLADNGCEPITNLTPEETYDLGLRRFVSNISMGRYGLRGLTKRYGQRKYALWNDLFPEQILPWTLAQSHEVWSKNPEETAAKAVRWLFEKYLMIRKEDIPLYATDNLFWRVGFSGILTNRRIGFSSSPYAAIDNAYPGEFSSEDFLAYRTTLRVPGLNDMRRKYKKKAVREKNELLAA